MFPAASACGGLFCATGPTQPVPVVQNAERIAFEIDEGFVEAHVQVFYEGPPDEFAWVVPVPSDAEVFTSHDVVFDVLDANLAPTFQTNTSVEGQCGRRGMSLGCAEYNIADSSSLDNLPVEAPPNVVTVTSQGQVGPYDYLILSASSPTALVDYLDAEGFDFDASMGDALAPYVVDGGSFLAFRLSKNNQVGDITPIGFRYAGDTASIPIQLTAIAATADMGIQVNVFGAERAVSTNYLHVDIDPAAIDWAQGGLNFFDLVARGVDEAGGHAFVTEYAGPTGSLQGAIWSDSHEVLAGDAMEATTFFGLEAIVMEMALPDHPSVRRATGFPLDDAEVPSIQAELAVFFDLLRDLQGMLDQPQVTRLSTTLDPAEMTLDPLFELHPNAPSVDQSRSRELITHCEGGRRRDPVLETVFDDGRSYQTADPRDRVDQAALQIRRWNGTELELVHDGLPAALEGSDPAVREGCGCAGRSWSAGVFTVLLGLVGLRRRR